MKHRKLYSVLAALILASMILVACQPAAQPTEVITEEPAVTTEEPMVTEEPVMTEAPTEAVATEAPTEAATEPPVTTEGGTLVLAQSADAGTLDPAVETSANSLQPIYHIYE